MDQEERRSLRVFVPASLVRRAKALAAIEDREVFTTEEPVALRLRKDDFGKWKADRP